MQPITKLQEEILLSTVHHPYDVDTLQNIVRYDIGDLLDSVIDLHRNGLVRLFGDGTEPGNVYVGISERGRLLLRRKSME